MDVKTCIPLLNVENVPSSIQFYRDLLGFEVAAQAEYGGGVRWARIEREGLSLMLNQPDDADSSQRRGRSNYSDAVFYFDVEDAQQSHGECKAGNYGVSEISHEEYGWEFFIRDPDGYVLGFTDTK
jgi:glyoxylase I family protein